MTNKLAQSGLKNSHNKQVSQGRGVTMCLKDIWNEVSCFIDRLQIDSALIFLRGRCNSGVYHKGLLRAVAAAQALLGFLRLFLINWQGGDWCYCIAKYLLWYCKSSEANCLPSWLYWISSFVLLVAHRTCTK